MNNNPNGYGNYDANGDLNYQYVPVTGEDPNTQAANDSRTQMATQTGEQFTSKINDNVAQQSNLMGNQTPQDSLGAALQSSAQNTYSSQINSMMRQAKMAGTDMQNQVQTQNVQHQAATFTNAQSRAQLNYQQITFQRKSAIEMENYKRQLFGQLFGGVAAVGGVAAGSIASMSTPTEPSNGAPGPAGSFSMGSGGMSTLSYNSSNFGPIGGR